MNANIITLKNIGFALLTLSALSMIIMSITGTAVSVNMELSSCTMPAQDSIYSESCGIEISEKKISGMFIATIIVGVLGVVTLVTDLIREKRIG